jgi:dTDP-4-dehydrorhamnose 3,5-epimerase
MKFTELPIPGAYLIEMEPISDERGFFARSWCKREFEQRQLTADLAQCSVSFNAKKGTLRGLHFQAKPFQEAKLVRCTQGAVYDVIVDLRPDSNTYLDWYAAELSAGNRRSLYIPFDVAHGFQTLADDTEVFYQMSEFYHPESARGVRWDDPAIGVNWPLASPIISAQDASYPLLNR